MLKRYIGDRAFYRRLLLIALPIMIQNGISNFVSLLDNIMVGQVGTVQMSGVSIVNQILFVFNLSIFGAASGAGIFTAQFHGSRDNEGIRHTFRFKLMICLLLAAVWIAVLIFGGETLIGLYLRGEGDPQDAALTLEYGMSYVKIMLLGLLPFAICNAYSGTLRETGQTVVPMVAGIISVLTNLILNYILIFGHFGAPKMGIAGAAVATVISRYVELLVVALWTHRHSHLHPFIKGVYRSMYIPRKLFLDICKKGLPLLANEFLWASGIALVNQAFSTCGLNVVPATNIANTINNLVIVSFLALGNAVGIIMGQMLGANRPLDEIRDTNRKLITTSILTGVGCLIVLSLLARPFPHLYNTSEDIRTLATKLIFITAFVLPFDAYNNAAYFTLRSGGQTFITFLYDSFFMCVFAVPLVFCLANFTAITILPLFAVYQATNLVKCVVGFVTIRRGKWIQNLTI